MKTQFKLVFEPEAQEIFVRFYQELKGIKFSISGLNEQVQKYEGLFARLCIVHHMMKVFSAAKNPSELKKGNIPHAVGQDTAQAVNELVMGFCLPHATKIYGYFGEHPGREVAEKIADWILQTKRTTFKHRDVVKLAPQKQTKQLEAPLEYLEQMGWVHIEELGRISGKGGRKGERILVNPKVLERFGSV